VVVVAAEEVEEVAALALALALAPLGALAHEVEVEEEEDAAPLLRPRVPHPRVPHPRVPLHPLEALAPVAEEVEEVDVGVPVPLHPLEALAPEAEDVDVGVVGAVALLHHLHHQGELTFKKAFITYEPPTNPMETPRRTGDSPSGDSTTSTPTTASEIAALRGCTLTMVDGETPYGE
jgi:hypothetical protein